MILDDPTVIERWRQAGWWGTTTIDALLRACVAGRRDQLALVDAPNRTRFAPGEPQRLTFGEVDERADRLAAALYGVGVRKDAVVLVQLPNVVEIVIAFLACARLGAIVSPIMLAYGERDVQRIVRHVRPAAILTLATFKDAHPARVAAAAAAHGPVRPPAVLALGEDTAEGMLCAASLEQFPADLAALHAYLATLFERIRKTDLLLQVGSIAPPPPQAAPQVKEPVYRVRLRSCYEETGSEHEPVNATITKLPYRIGRAYFDTGVASLARNDLSINDSAPFQLSRNHCEIDFEHGHFVLRDRGSKLGSLVNGEAVSVDSGRISVPLPKGENTIILGNADSPHRFSLTVEEIV